MRLAKLSMANRGPSPLRHALSTKSQVQVAKVSLNVLLWNAAHRLWCSYVLSHPANMSSHLPFSFLFLRLLWDFFSLAHNSQGCCAVQFCLCFVSVCCSRSACEVVEPRWDFLSGLAWGNLISSRSRSHLTYHCYYCWCSDPQWG